MNVDVTKIIHSTKNLPSLPGVAVSIIRMANNPEASVANAVSLLSKDPAIVGRMLRVVNSPIYVKAKPRGVETLKEAIVIMGLNASLNLALSFTLLKAFKGAEDSGLDYELYWRRALLSALAARVIGVQVGVLDMEELFLAGLLQDIGMVVLDQLQPEFYAELGEKQFDHEELLRYERARMYTDHAQIGGLILNQWHLPMRTCKTVLRSHDPSDVDEDHPVGRFVRCVALSGRVADLFVGTEKMKQYCELSKSAQSYLHLKENVLQGIIETMVSTIPETEKLFSTHLVCNQSAADILKQAKDSWQMRVSSG